MLNSRLMRPSISITGTCASASFAVMCLAQLVDHALGGAAAALDPRPQRLVRLRLEVAERQLLELVLDLAHAEAVGDRRVDVARLLRDLDAALLGQVVQRPHVVQPVGELHQDHADVVDHRQQHLAEVLRLPLLARRERDGPQLGDPFDDVGDVGAEQLADALDRRLRVLDDVVQQAGGNRHDVELHVRQLVGHLERVDQVGLPRVADLPLVLEGGEDVRPPEQLDVGVGVVRPGPFRRGPRTGSWMRCLTVSDAGIRPGGPLGPLSTGGEPLLTGVFWFTILTRFGAGKPPDRAPRDRIIATEALGSILIPTFGRARHRQAPIALEGSMRKRFRSVSAASVALVLLAGAATAGCGRYSFGTLKAKKAYKDANGSIRRRSGRRPPTGTRLRPPRTPPGLFFYLANSYDNLYKPTRAGEPENDAYIQKAIENYRKAAETDPAAEHARSWRCSTSVAAYGPEKLNNPAKPSRSSRR